MRKKVLIAMKTILIPLIASYLVADASAQLDCQKKQAGLKYGGFKDNRALVTEYQKKGCHVEAVFNQGFIIAITYRMYAGSNIAASRQMTRDELQKFLSDNHSAGGWEKVGARKWIHKKEEKTAVYVDSEHRLYVWKNFYNDEYSWNRNVEIWDSLGDFYDDYELALYRRMQSVVCGAK